MPEILMRIFSVIISKKKIIGWVGAIILAGAAIVLKMPVLEVKDSVCGAPVIQVPENLQAKPVIVGPVEKPVGNVDKK